MNLADFSVGVSPKEVFNYLEGGEELKNCHSIAHNILREVDMTYKVGKVSARGVHSGDGGGKFWSMNRKCSWRVKVKV